MAYSPERRTAVVLSGTGAHGAYHAGVLRACQEAGVKVDVFAGHGVGSMGAAIAAIDGSARLSDPGGVWAHPDVAGLYAWTPLLRLVARLGGLVLVTLLVVPVSLVTISVPAYAVGFLAATLGAGTGLLDAYAGWLSRLVAGPWLLTTVPQLVAMEVAVLAAIVAFVAWRQPYRDGRRGGALLWRPVGAPMDGAGVTRHAVSAMWTLIRGAAPVEPPGLDVVSRRYTEVLQENLGQPGFREVVFAATDLDARRDVVGAFLVEPYRGRFLAAAAERGRQDEVLDFAGASAAHVLDLLVAGLAPPVICEPHRTTFAASSHWRGETHRMCDRPGGIQRLLEALADAGVSQVVIVTAVAAVGGPHRMPSASGDPRGRLGAFIEAAEASALRDALEMARLRFDGVWVVRPSHNPIGPFDVRGAYDRASDRQHELGELVLRGHDDAYRQFIEPVVGASGEHLAGAAAHARPDAGPGTPATAWPSADRR